MQLNMEFFAENLIKLKIFGIFLKPDIFFVNTFTRKKYRYKNMLILMQWNPKYRYLRKLFGILNT